MTNRILYLTTVDWTRYEQAHTDECELLYLYSIVHICVDNHCESNKLIWLRLRAVRQHRKFIRYDIIFHLSLHFVTFFLDLP